MRPDQNIHQSFFQIFCCLLLLGRRPKPAEQIHAHRKFFHPLHKRVVMLLCQNRCRHQIYHLFSVLDRLKCSPNGNFRLSVSDVSADQAVHDLFALHVLLGIGDLLQLVIGLLKREHFFKFLLPDRIRFILISILLLPCRIQLHQIPGNLSDCPAHLILCFRPLVTSQLVQLWLFCICSCILLDQIQLRCKNIQAASSRIRNFHIIFGDLIYFNLFNSLIDTQTMIFMYHIISNL